MRSDADFRGLVKSTPLTITDEGNRRVVVILAFMDNLPTSDPETANRVLAESVLGIIASYAGSMAEGFPTIGRRVSACFIK